MTIIDDKYRLLGGGRGFLGAPTTEELWTPNGLGKYRHYKHGSIYWKTTSKHAYEIHGLIRERWASLGWENSFLGFPETDETSVAGRRGRANTFERGVISWTPSTGAHEVYGYILERWNALGREGGFLGFPITDENITSDTRGRYNHFENGSIYWKLTSSLAFEIHGLIREKWVSLGRENSFLGLPMTNETSVAGGRGRANGFERGVIAWTPTTGAHEVHGVILERWTALGREDGSLGFPLMDETITPDARGRYNHFEYGSIYWTPNTGAHEVTGFIKDDWAQAGWERGLLGYPNSNPAQMRPTAMPTDFQDFEHGSLYNWLGDSRIVIRNPKWIETSGNMISIEWDDFGKLLPDRDRISVEFSGHAPNSNIQLTLNAGPGITWWKAVSLWSPAQGDIAEACTQDDYKTTTITIEPSKVEPSNVYLLFKKAKWWGVHTGMYWLWRADRLIGNNVTFTWIQDK